MYPLKLIPVPNFNSPGCLGAQLESVTYVRTHGWTDGQTPGEYRANSGPAGLVPVPELSNTNEPNETSKVIEKKPFSSRIFKK